ncbi:MAG: thiamine diphosphokinase [Anaerolineae bacterium]|nr:thiamine diphosphokinase [Anaerolineae bacterium]
MTTIIFLNGEIGDYPAAGKLLTGDDFIIAADGGARHCKALGLTPQVLVGDMDSLADEEVQSFERLGVEVLRYHADKDETDFELALRYAYEKGLMDVLILGAYGGRIDQSWANFLLPAFTQFQGMQIRFWIDGQWVFPVLNRLEIEAPVGSTVSLIPLGGDACGVSTQGLAWRLDNENLLFGSSRGVSNRMAAAKASVRLREGMLLCFVINQD